MLYVGDIPPETPVSENCNCQTTKPDIESGQQDHLLTPLTHLKP